MDDPAAGRRPTKLVLAGLGLFVLAVVVGRLLIHGGIAWAILALALPVVLVVLGAAFGFRAAFVLTAFFAGAVLAARWFVRENPAGWAALLLLPVVAFSGMIVGRVLSQLRRKPRAQDDPGDAPVQP